MVKRRTLDKKKKNKKIISNVIKLEGDSTQKKRNE